MRIAKNLHSISAFFLLVLIGCGGGSPPRELSPRVVKSSGAVALATSRAVKGLNIITDIELTREGYVIVVGDEGVIVLSSSLEPISTGRFRKIQAQQADLI